jgi:uncharacterized protein with ParB-like and HNH nuclease domain
MGTSDMAGELQNLGEIFNNRVFRVPDYQRGFAWGEPQLTDFWEDLNRLDERRKHYTGQLTLEAVRESDWKQWDEDTRNVPVAVEIGRQASIASGY